jgi:hypothetical protein
MSKAAVDHSVDLEHVRTVLERKDLPAQQNVDLTHGVQFRRTTQGVAVMRVHYCSDPDRCIHIDDSWQKSAKAKTNSKAKWDREQEIIHEAGGGELVLADVFRDHWNTIVVDDPKWRPDPGWTETRGGFDYGKTNPTAMLKAYIDFEGGIWFAGEYYQPGLAPSEHAKLLVQMPGYEQMAPIYADPTIFDLTVATAGKEFTSIDRIYREQGITRFSPFQGDRSDVTFSERLFEHWANIAGGRKPTIHIVCRKPHDRPTYGLHPYDCPNLLWELKRMRRVESSAAYLQKHNPSESIVDKNNHLRDCMKYITMSLPRPSLVPMQKMIEEKLKNITDPTSKAIAVQRLLKTEQPTHGVVTLLRKAGRRSPR